MIRDTVRKVAQGGIDGSGEQRIRERKEYEMKMNAIRRRMVIMLAAFSMALGLFTIQASAEKGDERFLQKANEIAAQFMTEPVKTIRWKAKLTANVKTSELTTGEEIKLQKGKNVTIIQRDYHKNSGVSLCQSGEGQFYIANKYLDIFKPMATGKSGDYSLEAKLAYINNQNIGSSTDTLIWISLDKQRVNVFKGSNGAWSLVKTMKTSTGKEDAPTLDETFKYYYVVQKKAMTVKGLQYYTFFYGSGMHKWPGSISKKAYGKIPVSHSCVRLKEKHAKWIYDSDNVPLDTRVWIW